ncbi:hypothetical protein ACH5RR_017395 [Cinchona calisaya]|uniref:Subtilisin-like protease n=1 Tax=Cinchona calisaya TaxID=153742 RepID=A0ABD2ZID7_9GENT
MTIMFSSKVSNLLLLLFISFLAFQQVLALKQSYIVYLGGHSHGPEITLDDLQRVTDSHHDFLASFLGSKEHAKDAIFYSYQRHINGFAAILEEEDASKIAKHPDVISVFLNRGKKLHTTHSWDFLMLENRNGVVNRKSLWRKANFGKDVIIATLDTGVWPESRSFSGKGFGPIPSKWKGVCENATSVPCNRKLIGTRYFNKGYVALRGKPLPPSLNTARDHVGHGTHTLSTAGGNFVAGANVLGVANGTAKGGSPKARVAAYKVCWPPVGLSECADADILQAFDVAIDDGVDVISVSLGGEPLPYYEDGIAIGSFHALQKNVVVVCSAGNSGPIPGTVSNVAPWFITVGASTMDRQFQASVQLPNHLILKGASLSQALPEKKFYPLIRADQAKASNASIHDAKLCIGGTLDKRKAEGKILVCLRGENDRVDKGYQAAMVGAAGMILANDNTTGNEIIADPHFLPAVQITYKDGLKLFAYMNSTIDPKGYIQPPETIVPVKPAPMMAAFSSRGPNIIAPHILKPDITAPGVNVLAAYSEEVSPTDEDYDKRRTLFNTLSGTSMSCPHISGIVGLLKTLHPDWSPAAIRSAIMTTARSRDNTVKPMLDSFDYKRATPFGYGSGHVRPNRAADPGLVYDLTVKDHLDFLCAMGYNQKEIGLLYPYGHKCPGPHKKFNLADFNYPSISVPDLNATNNTQVTLTRRLKNVGTPGTYFAHIRKPAGVWVTVDPPTLTFEKIGQEKSFKLTLKAKAHMHVGSDKFGELTWSDGHHYVRSPIVVAAPLLP